MRSIRIPLAERLIDGGGAAYVCYADATERGDGRFDVRLMYVGEGNSHITLKPQTTQSNEADISRWVQGLSRTHIENAFRDASRATNGSGKSIAAPEATQLNIDEFIDSVFAARGSETIETQNLFDSGTFANADVIRELQRLEREGRIARFTWNGTDFVSRAALQAQPVLAPEKTSSNRPVAPPRLFTMHSTPVKQGRADFMAYVFGVERADGTWAGWIEFRDRDGGVLRTDEETSQPNEQALAYWATGLEPLYLEGAIGRAK